VSWVHVVTPIPDNLESFAAASLLCAGVTVYRALKYSETNPGDWVVIPGAGGGLGHLGKLCSLWSHSRLTLPSGSIRQIYWSEGDCH